MKLIVGLGNPGRKYQQTRHNLGFLLIDRLATHAGATAAREECQALVQKVPLADSPYLLAKPLTYMNLSGQAVSALVARYSVNVTNELLIVSDDVALPIGRLRLRAQGSAGGHNGLKSIIAELGTQQFPRLRLGIQPEQQIEDLANFVLTKFAASERDIVEAMLTRAEEAINIWLAEGSERASAFANAKVIDG
ncbi:MAG: aminoacyl-tRNA hydrolase [Acidobacteriota bacterium]